MKYTPQKCTVSELHELRKTQMLFANPEYQRGIVWNKTQKRKLIDSIMRGYPIPLIYMHFIENNAAGLKSQRLEIIDGQQRINAICEYIDGAYNLFDPIKDEKEAKFPKFIKSEPCPWAAKRFSELSEDLRHKLCNVEIPIVRIETHNEFEARDLFVRLQAGIPLNSQEKRDAWPGQFTDFILHLGGKPGIDRYPGHEFFTEAIGVRKNDDRGKMRQLAAQVAMLYFTQRRYKSYCDINSSAIDDFYYENLDFDSSSDEATRLRKLLDSLARCLKGTGIKKLQAHEVIHLVLYTSSLNDDYVSTWEFDIVNAFENFRKRFNDAKQTKNSPVPSVYWLDYGIHTRVNSDMRDTIGRRQRFFAAEMTAILNPKPKDPQRSFTDIEREAIYYSHKKQCAVCHQIIKWDELDIHHIQPHYAGGHTRIENGVPVHRACHPKGTQ